MRLNPELIETIKGHFAKKTSSELRAMLEARDTATMSGEAFEAAEAVLAERSRGVAAEPGMERAVPPNSPPHPWLDHALAWGLVWILRGFALLAAIYGGTIGLAALTSHGGGKDVLLVAFQVACVVVGPLVVAEMLRLGILIEGNTRRTAPPRE
jgi:hypothetical protein